MERIDAMEKYFKKIPHATRTLKRFLTWEKNKTLTQNAETLRMSDLTARTFSHRFGLKFLKLKNSGVRGKSLKMKAYSDLRDSGWSLPDIGMLFNVTRQAVLDGINRLKED